MTSEGPARARRGRPGYDQATVLRRAIDLFNRQGYDGTSVTPTRAAPARNSASSSSVVRPRR